MGKVTGSPVQSSPVHRGCCDPVTAGPQQDSAAREENGTLKALWCRAVAQDWGGFTCLGRMGWSLSLKARWIGRCAAPWTRPKGDDRMPRPTRGGTGQLRAGRARRCCKSGVMETGLGTVAAVCTTQGHSPVGARRVWAARGNRRGSADVGVLTDHCSPEAAGQVCCCGGGGGGGGKRSR